MEEITSMVLDGVVCELCGRYLGSAVGYPRLCLDCAKEEFKEEKEVTKKEHPFSS